MDNPFKAFENDLKHLKPQIRLRALTIAAQLTEEGYEPQDAIKEGIKRAENWFLDAEG